MRLRFKSYAEPELNACPFFVRAAQAHCGQWRAQFARSSQLLHLELGCGKGGFLAQLAAQNPHINYIGIDLTDKVLVLAKRNIEAVATAQGRTPDNVRLLSHDIERISTALGAADAVQRVYINFCNPWNKKAGQTKHRLTHTRQLLKYRSLLAPDAQLYFKCDDDNLFADTLEYLPKAGFVIDWKTWDLHADEPAWNIRTEHEQMFTEKGLPTHALIATMTALAQSAEERKAKGKQAAHWL